MKDIVRVALVSFLGGAYIAAADCYGIEALSDIMSKCSGCELSDHALFFSGCTSNFGKPENMTYGSSAPSDGVVCYKCILTDGIGIVDTPGYAYNFALNAKKGLAMNPGDGHPASGTMFCPGSAGNDLPFDACPENAANDAGTNKARLWNLMLVLIAGSFGKDI
eukprot:TRINITY_DN96296_c0_g1_i1.p1 TRINITY_DN96296_c0_g1~~TRINITY_DN96296_c0_g1_i1.p1  ORF type:complete len:164 (+),score=24.83 TRINITY_DN96296_c0_g1_i1:124-615(+)